MSCNHETKEVFTMYSLTDKEIYPHDSIMTEQEVKFVTSTMNINAHLVQSPGEGKAEFMVFTRDSLPFEYVRDVCLSRHQKAFIWEGKVYLRDGDVFIYSGTQSIRSKDPTEHYIDFLDSPLMYISFKND